MNNGAVRGTALSGDGTVGMNSPGINQNSFSGMQDDTLTVYMIFQFSLCNIKVFQIFVPVIRNKIVLIS